MTTATKASPMTGLSRLTGSEFRLMFRDPGVFFVLGIPILLVLIFGLIPAMSSPSPDFGGGRFIDYYVPVLVTMIIAMLSLNVLAGVLGTYRERGVLRRLGVTPVRPAALLMAQALVNLAVLLAMTVALLLIANLAFDVPMPRQLPGFLLALVLSIGAMFGLGLVIAALAPNGKAANGIGTVLFFPLGFLAGLWTPGPLMPSAIRHIADFSPLGAGVQAMQRAWDGSFPEPLHLIVLVAYTAGLGFLAAKVFRWD
ncbi:ABC transporter permease [Actinocrispum sp. NPDC049592]|uniref:ABC transporter permease n=1 Tax=Actinocrispum sp. NPDC049592 TaxID=3154835 RepID=UPI00342AED15